MANIQNDIPEIVLELAREAIALGLHEVHVSFGHLGADYSSPIEWILFLSKVEYANNEEANFLRASALRNQPLEAYRRGEPSKDNPLGGFYWDAEQIRAWMQEPLADDLAIDGEYASWVPQEDEEIRRFLLGHWELFELGVRNGWSMEHRTNWRDAERLKKMFSERDGSEGAAREILPVRTLKWNASNNFYNREGHPAHRSTGTPVSTGGWVMAHDSGSVDRRKQNHGPTHFDSISEEETLAILGNSAPWFVRVALFDEETEEWMYFPEALEDEKFTIRADSKEKE